MKKKKINDCPICRRVYRNNYFDRSTIEKWTEKGNKIDIGLLNLFDKLSSKTIIKIVKSLNLNYKLCLNREELLELYNNYISNLTLKEIKKFLDSKRISYSNYLEKKNLILLYEIYIIRSLK